MATQCLEIKFDLVVSGINAGGNLGVDTAYSGTVAAAREAHFWGIPAFAFSMVLTKGIEPEWDKASLATSEILKDWLSEDRDGSTYPDQLKATTFQNINFPSKIPQAPPTWCALDPSPHRCEFEASEQGYIYKRGNYHLRPRKKGSDVDLCFSGHITQTDLMETAIR
jgi:5'-nucleotidase